MYVPKTKGEVVEHLSWMILSGPEFKSWSSGKGDIDTAFSALREGLRNIRADARENGFTDLCGMADEARLFFQSGEIKEANYKLHDMQRYIRMRGWVSDDWRTKAKLR